MHPYIESSASCWAKFGELSAREYRDREFAGAHQLSVDTYAVQHPGQPGRRAIQSVAIHLMTLGMMLERNTDPVAARNLHRRMVRSEFVWLEPPATRGTLTVVDVLVATSASEHRSLVNAWAKDVWTAWSAHHATVAGWIERSLPD